MALVAALLAAGALTAPAQARQGTGLYAPFPSPTGGERAERFVADFGVRASTRQVQAGTSIPGAGLAVTGVSGAAAGRAGTRQDARTGELLGGLAVALLVAGAGALGARRRHSGARRA